MKFIKQLTCLIACFVLLSSSFMVGYAVEEEEYFPTVDDLFDIGFVFDGEAYVYTGDDDPFDLGFSFFFSNHKNSPDFNPLDLPWLQMPDYVKDIINIDVSSYMPFSNNLNIPFVVLRVRPTVVEVYVGVNCFLGRLSNATASFSIFAAIDDTALSDNSRCYTAIYTHNGSIYQDWSECNYTKVGDRNTVYQVAPYYFGNMDSGELDYYVWGGNAGKVGNYDAVNIPIDTSDQNIQISLYQSTSGFSSGRFLPFQEQYPFQYFEYFSPLTDDDYQIHLEQEQNGLLEDILGEFQASGESDLTTLPGEALEDFNKAESELVDDYNPDDLEDDLDIDFDNSALNFVWDLVDDFVTADNTVFTLFVSILSLGIIALILGR